MKFFQDNNPPRVWDKVKSKVTVVFQNGAFETDDPTLIDLLVRVGYRYDGVFPKPAQKMKPARVISSKPKQMVRKTK